MAFLRIRTIQGKKYLYREERRRVGKKVKSISTYLGSIAAFISVNLSMEGRGIERMAEEADSERAAIERLKLASLEDVANATKTRGGGASFPAAGSLTSNVAQPAAPLCEIPALPEATSEP